jgi:hypothetical protein
MTQWVKAFGRTRFIRGIARALTFDGGRSRQPCTIGRNRYLTVHLSARPARVSDEPRQSAQSNGIFTGWNQIGGSNTSYTVKT